MEQMNKNCFLSLSLLVLTFVINKSSALVPDFSYLSVEYWPKMYPECGGQRQSPVSFNWKNIVPKNDSFLMVNYGKKPSSAKLLNDGHTLIVRFTWDDDQVPYLTGQFLEEHEYVFDSLYFRWNRIYQEGAEHCFNNAECSPLEMQLFHYNRKYGSVENASNFTDGFVICSAVLEYKKKGFRMSHPVNDVLSNVGSVRSPGSSADIEPFILSDMSPNRRKEKTFLAYSGSLTVPPCTENVVWLLNTENFYVMKETVEFFKSTFEFRYGDFRNNRDRQPLNGRNLTLLSGIGDAVI